MDKDERKLASEYWKRVKTLIKERGITQSILCEKTGIDIGKLKSQITNEVAPKIFDVLAVAKYFDVSMEFLAGENEKDTYKQKYENLKNSVQNAINEN